MASRLNLQKELCEVLGNKNVYFQPPETLKLQYPCIIYNLSDITTDKADDNNYILSHRYKVLLVHKDPDNNIKEKLLTSFESIRMSACYTSNNMNHYNYDLYY